MSEHLTEEEQIEKLKQWWNDHGKSTLLTVVLLVGGYFGWQNWQDHTQRQAEMASEVYDQMQLVLADQQPGQSLTDDQEAAIYKSAAMLKEEYAGSQYAHYASLILARLAVEDNDLDKAVSDLQSVVSSAEDGLKNIATLRLAKVYVAKGDFDQALSLINGQNPRDLKAAYDELRGDIHYAKGDVDEAYSFYSSALADANTDRTTRAILELKLSQVKPVFTEEEPATTEEQG